VKRSVRDESTWVVTHFVHGSNARNLSVQLSLSQLAKTLCLSYYAYVFSSTKLEIRAEQVLPGNKGGWWGEGVGGEQGGGLAQTMYAHVNKCIKNFFKKSNLKSKIF
jgi:hypothetical protein